LGGGVQTFRFFREGPINFAGNSAINDMIMRPPIERIVTLNDLVDSVPEEVFLQIQNESQKSQQTQSNENNNMAAGKDVSKSQRIRDYLDSHPNAKGKEIISALSQYGVKQTDIGNVKAKMKKEGVVPKARSASAPKASTAAASSNSFGISFPALEAGTKFLKEAGSLANAKEILTIIDQIGTALKN
jgi:hypothetical protein